MKLRLHLPLLITSLLFATTSFAENEHMKREFGLHETHGEPHSDYYGPKRRNRPPGYPVTGPYGIDESDTWNKHSHEEHTAKERLRDKN